MYERINYIFIVGGIYFCSGYLFNDLGVVNYVKGFRKGSTIFLVISVLASVAMLICGVLAEIAVVFGVE